MSSIQKVSRSIDSNCHMNSHAMYCHTREGGYPEQNIGFFTNKALDSRLRGNDGGTHVSSKCVSDITSIVRGRVKSSLDKATSEKVAKLLHQYYALRMQFNDQEVPVCSAL